MRNRMMTLYARYALTLVLATAAVLAAHAGPRTGATADAGLASPAFDLANGCYLLRARASDGYVVAGRPGAYHATAADTGGAMAFYLKPTGLGTYLFYDRDRRLLAVRDPLGRAVDALGARLDALGGEVAGTGDVVDFLELLAPLGEVVGQTGLAVRDLGGKLADVNGRGRRLVRVRRAGPLAEWRLLDNGPQGFEIIATATNRRLIATEDGALSMAASDEASGDGFDFVSHEGCTPFPEAELGAHGQPFTGTLSDDTVFGIADTHTHIMAYERLGGRVIHGEPFDRFGIRRALNNGYADHGPNGTTDVIGNILRNTNPVGSHDTHGWPTFPDWPAAATYSHQQSYYVWLKRAWIAGVRLMVNQFSADEALCQLAPLKDHGCDALDNVRRQRDGLLQLQDYIDAQAGGPGEGFFRVVTGPAEARRVIENGKLAVIMGVETSKLFDCGEFLDDAECGRTQIEDRIAAYRDLGIRSVFVAHWFDNAYAGAGLFDQSELFLNLLNKLETGQYFGVEGCPEKDAGMGAELQSFGVHLKAGNALTNLLNDVQSAALPTYGPGLQCNARGLTSLGEYVIDRLMANHFIIEIDHLGARAKNQVLDIAETNGYPLMSGHTGAGGTTTPKQLTRIYATGGLSGPFNDAAPKLRDTILDMRDFKDDRYYFGVGFASDTGGLASQPGPRDGQPLRYPFTSYDGKVTFVRQRTGDRVFDLNHDGVAHYGLYADLFADMQRLPRGEQAMQLLFRSAEAYLQMWSRAVDRP